MSEIPEDIPAVNDEPDFIQSLKHDSWVLHFAGSIEIAVRNSSVMELLHEVETLRKAIHEAVLAERERCAKIADEQAWAHGGEFFNGPEQNCAAIAAAIRSPK